MENGRLIAEGAFGVGVWMALFPQYPIGIVLEARVAI